MTIEAAHVIPEFTIADRLRKAREVTGLDQSAFADQIGVTRATISNAERGVTAPRKILLNAWSLASGVPLEWIQTGEVKNETPSPDGEGVNEELCAPRDSNPEPID